MCDNCRSDSVAIPGAGPAGEELATATIAGPGAGAVALELDNTAPAPGAATDPGDPGDRRDPWGDTEHATITILCTNCGYQYVATLNCGDRTCPECRRRWYGYHYKSLKKIFGPVVSDLKFLTLTLKNIPDNDFNKDKVKYLRKCFNKLVHNKIYPWNKLDKRRFGDLMKAGFYFIQLTNTGRGFHLHLHVIYAGDFIPRELIKEAWRRITGDSFIIDIRKVNDVGRAVKYLLGDLLQRPRIRPGDRTKYNEALKGARLIQGFGSWAKLKIRTPFVCPNCENDNWLVPKYERNRDPDYWNPWDSS